MSAATTECQVLYGILAVQQGLISRDEMITALKFWISRADGSSLAELLVASGVLSATERDSLDSTFGEQLALHDGSVEKVLGTIAPSGPLRDDLATLGNPDVHATLAHMAVTPADCISHISAEPSSIADDEQHRYRPVRAHAAGGLGQVSVAVDRQLSREVAFKELQNRFADDPSSRQRFLREAKHTGRLEHPGVVPVYGVGQHADGRPFYAMRFVHGDTLQSAIDEFHQRRQRGELNRDYEFELRKLLQRFLDVCQAIDYAHSRGVLHRDLKPSNVMLGNYGETLVIDWGLAKQLAFAEDEGAESSFSELAPFLTNAAIGTPGYMSPEQAAGDSSALGTSSDVYSLGATLYSLLTGKPPFTGGNLDQILDDCRSDRYPRPRVVDPWIPKPVEAICLKAMALRESNRYGSARELADDVERWLADEPTSAYRESFLERASRWSRRHKEISTILVLLFLASLISAGALLIQTRLRFRESQIEANKRSAESGANEISSAVSNSVRWLVIKARDSNVIDSLTKVPENLPGDNPYVALQDFVGSLYHDRVFDPNSDQIHFDSLLIYLNDQSGSQIARTPQEISGALRGFNYRDYFHGKGPLAEEEFLQSIRQGKKPEIDPIRQPYLSSPFTSSTTGKKKVILSVPIWADQERRPPTEPLGIMSAAIPVEEFSDLVDRSHFRKGRMALVSMRKMTSDDKPSEAEIISHSNLSLWEKPKDTLRLGEGVTNKILESGGKPFTVEDYSDPLLAGEGWVATFWPVPFEVADYSLDDTRLSSDPKWWIVIMEQLD